MKPILVLLTNFNHNFLNEIEEEDIFLADYLRKYFHVIVSHPLDCGKVEDIADLILIRNVWPVFDYEEEWNKIKQRFTEKGLKVYPPLSAKGDMLGKDYLIKLYSLGYPVIPTIDNPKYLEKFGSPNLYFIKPKNKCDAIGTERLTKSSLVLKNLRNYIIQPFINFKYEVSFYVIDGKIVYSFSTPKKTGDYKIKSYKPTTKDREFVHKFTKWNGLSNSLQRVDACRTHDGSLLLVELEDFSPYLHLLDMDEEIREKFLNALVKSLKKHLES